MDGIWRRLIKSNTNVCVYHRSLFHEQTQSIDFAYCQWLLIPENQESTHVE